MSMTDEKVLELLESINATLSEIRDTFASMAAAFASVAEEESEGAPGPQEGDTDALAEAISRLAGNDEPDYGITAWGRPKGWGNDGD